MYTRLGYTAADVAKFLQVSERTVHNWVAGSVRVPHAAYKLLRVHLRYELPGDGWQGWHFSAGKLWTPEGHSIHPVEWSWWSLMARKAASFEKLYHENGLLKAELETLHHRLQDGNSRGACEPMNDTRCHPAARWRGRRGPACGVAPADAKRRLDLSLGHFGTSPAKAVGSHSEEQPGAPLVGAGGMGVQNPHANGGQPMTVATKSGVSARHRLNRSQGGKS
ncbi:hypothetical protein GCM10027292_16840 [Hydrogenophaga aquatica]